jgi:predicted DNA-binding protein (UPF0251 family)
MNLDESTTLEIIERTAQILADRIEAEFGRLDEIVLIDVSTAAQALGCSRPHVRKVLPPVRVSPRLEGISLAALKQFQAERSAKPMKISRK